MRTGKAGHDLWKDLKALFNQLFVPLIAAVALSPSLLFSLKFTLWLSCLFSLPGISIYLLCSSQVGLHIPGLDPSNLLSCLTHCLDPHKRPRAQANTGSFLECSEMREGFKPLNHTIFIPVTLERRK